MRCWISGMTAIGPDMKEDFQIAVVGAGPAGCTAAETAAALGARVGAHRAQERDWHARAVRRLSSRGARAAGAHAPRPSSRDAAGHSRALHPAPHQSAAHLIRPPERPRNSPLRDGW